MEQASEGSLTRPKKAVPAGCGDDEDEEESIVDTVMKFLPGPLSACPFHSDVHIEKLPDRKL